MQKIHFVPNIGRAIVLVPREQLRQTRHGRTLKVPFHLRALAAVTPTPPAAWDGSKGRTIKYPILGNDQVGDCYYADACHCTQTFAGNAGTLLTFNAAAVVARYRVLSGGDNGLGDQQIFPEWQAGIVGPNGPHKILDDMTVNPNDDAAIRLGMWLFCGASYTAALPDAWIADPQPGQVWDAATPDPNNGHAMHLSGFDAHYYYDETWGFDPAIRLTPAGLKSSDPEVTVQFSLEMFNAQGVAPHNGMTYDQLAALWVQLGGHALPPSPFPPPVPPGPTPVPPPQPPPPVPVVGPSLAAVDACDEDVFRRLQNAFARVRGAASVLNAARTMLEAEHAALYAGK